MKFIISESKIFKPLTKYFNEFINSPEYQWIDKIEVKIDDTLNHGWKVSIPLFKYFVYVKPGFEPSPLKLAYLEKEINKKHYSLFPLKSDDYLSAYYSIEYIK